MGRTIIGVVLAMMLPAQSFALTSLCVETGSTGYNWRDGQWVETTYSLDQYLVQDVSENEELRGYFCTPEAPVTSTYGSISAKRCFSAAIVGEQRTVADTASCTVYYDRDGETVSSVTCSGGYINYDFTPTGEFVLTRTYSAPLANPTAQQRDSLVLSIGKCSAITP